MFYRFIIDVFTSLIVELIATIPLKLYKLGIPPPEGGAGILLVELLLVEVFEVVFVLFDEVLEFAVSVDDVVDELDVMASIVKLGDYCNYLLRKRVSIKWAFEYWTCMTFPVKLKMLQFLKVVLPLRIM